MSIGDLLIVALCLLAGWSLVSLVYAKSATGTLRKLGDREFPDQELQERWPAILQVSSAASTDDIDVAFQKRLDVLRQSFPSVMTEVELRQFDRCSDVLRRARDLSAMRRALP
jgi:hypothetical protein